MSPVCHAPPSHDIQNQSATHLNAEYSIEFFDLANQGGILLTRREHNGQNPQSFRRGSAGLPDVTLRKISDRFPNV
jgi:hypothetical protein